MKKPVLDRYERMEDGRIVVDVAVGSVQELYRDFDRTSPYLKKDLDLDFADYLIECAREIGDREFVIRIDLLKAEEEAPMQRVQHSIPQYFIYLRELVTREIRTMFRKSFILFAVGFAFVAYSAVEMNRAGPDNPSVLTTVLREGLIIAAWVSLWQALAYVLFEWHPHRQSIKLYRRIENAPIIFRVLSDESQPHPGQK